MGERFKAPGKGKGGSEGDHGAQEGSEQGEKRRRWRAGSVGHLKILFWSLVTVRSSMLKWVYSAADN